VSSVGSTLWGFVENESADCDTKTLKIFRGRRSLVLDPVLVRRLLRVQRCDAKPDETPIPPAHRPRTWSSRESFGEEKHGLGVAGYSVASFFFEDTAKVVMITRGGKHFRYSTVQYQDL